MATPLLFTVPTAVTTAPDEYCTVKVTCPAVAGFPPLVTVADKFTLVLSVVAEAAAGVVEVAAPWGLTVSWAGPAVSVLAPTTGMLTESESVGALAWLTWRVKLAPVPPTVVEVSSALLARRRCSGRFPSPIR